MLSSSGKEARNLVDPLDRAVLIHWPSDKNSDHGQSPEEVYCVSK
jgi:hypothetical protein